MADFNVERMLSNPQLYQIAKKYADANFSGENLEFLVAVRNLATAVTPATEKTPVAQTKMKQIFKAYIQARAGEEGGIGGEEPVINLSSRVRDPILAEAGPEGGQSHFTVASFVKAADEIQKMIAADTMHRFQDDPSYKEYKILEDKIIAKESGLKHSRMHANVRGGQEELETLKNLRHITEILTKDSNLDQTLDAYIELKKKEMAKHASTPQFKSAGGGVSFKDAKDLKEQIQALKSTLKDVSDLKPAEIRQMNIGKDQDKIYQAIDDLEKSLEHDKEPRDPNAQKVIRNLKSALGDAKFSLELTLEPKGKPSAKL